jgi:hypothetical protein
MQDSFSNGSDEDYDDEIIQKTYEQHTRKAGNYRKQPYCALHTHFGKH